MKRWQVVEKANFDVDWHLVRYDLEALDHFTSKDDAMAAAKKHITKLNCDNALTKEEKKNSVEAFMFIDTQVYLGELDGKAWFLLDKHGKIICDPKHYQLDGKAQIAVREVPGT